MSELTFEQMLDESFKTIHNGEVVDGTVIDVKPDEIILNIGYKADGIITRSEYTNDNSVDLTTVVSVGDPMTVKVLKVNDGEGQVLLTYKRLVAEKGNERLKEAVMDLLDNRDGLVLGICNGFQALIKLGLVPEGKIVEQNAKSPTLTTNRIGRHVSKVAYTRIASNLSPWFNNVNVDDVFSIPVSHGEGRFVADEDVIQELFKNGQVATQYVDLNGDPTMNEEFNPNGSYHAIEGITSPDGRVLGKMGHSERRDSYVGINIYGQKDQKIFESGVEYFK